MSSARRHRVGPILLLLSLCAGQVRLALAEEDDRGFAFFEPEPWKEQSVDLPAYPDGKHYVAVSLQLAGSDLEMSIDEPSLTIGDDGVVRYVMRLRSPGGAENLLYEGIRCATREWRSYAYGSSRSAWQSVDAAWKPIQAMGMGRYREQLYQYYLCRPAMGTLRREEMLQRMRYGVPRDPE